MEEPQPNTPPDHDFSSTVDTSRPFTSVKEAVAIFGERLLAGEFYSPKPSFSDTTTSAAYSPPSPSPSPNPNPNPNPIPIPIPIQREPSWRLSSPSPSPTLPPSPMKPKGEGDANDGNNNNVSGVLDTLKKLEAELEKTKAELKLLKERGSETEVALATLNAELHKNMSKLAEAEAAAAGKAAAAAKTVRFEINERENEGGDDHDIKEEKKKKKKEHISRMEDSKTLAQILSLGENDHLFGGGVGGGKLHKRKTMKHKPIIPLVGDLFFKRKASSTNLHNPLFASPF